MVGSLSLLGLFFHEIRETEYTLMKELANPSKVSNRGWQNNVLGT